MYLEKYNESGKHLLHSAKQCTGMHLACDEPNVENLYMLIDNRPIGLCSLSKKDSYIVAKSNVQTDIARLGMVYEVGSFYIDHAYRNMGYLRKMLNLLCDLVPKGSLIVSGIRTADTVNKTSIHSDAIPSLSVLLSEGFSFAGLDPSDLGLRFFKQG